jgi:hypothetical protein
MLCTGLQTSLKDISGHTFDDIQDFNALRITLQLGKDHGRRHSVKKTHPQLNLSNCIFQCTSPGEYIQRNPITKSLPLTHIYITAYFPGFGKARQ